MSESELISKKHKKDFVSMLCTYYDENLVHRKHNKKPNKVPSKAVKIFNAYSLFEDNAAYEEAAYELGPRPKVDIPDGWSLMDKVIENLSKQNTAQRDSGAIADPGTKSLNPKQADLEFHGMPPQKPSKPIAKTQESDTFQWNSTVGDFQHLEIIPDVPTPIMDGINRADKLIGTIPGRRKKKKKVRGTGRISASLRPLSERKALTEISVIDMLSVSTAYRSIPLREKLSLFGLFMNAWDILNHPDGLETPNCWMEYFDRGYNHSSRKEFFRTLFVRITRLLNANQANPVELRRPLVAIIKHYRAYAICHGLE